MPVWAFGAMVSFVYAHDLSSYLSARVHPWRSREGVLHSLFCFLLFGEGVEQIGRH
jgi:hypothetical protein